MSSELTVSDLARIDSGYAFKSKDWREEGLPVVKIGNVKDGFVSLEGCAFVSEEVAEKAPTFLAQEGDVLISLTGYVGQVGRVLPGVSTYVNQRVGLVRPHDRDDLSFIYFVLRSLRDEIVKLGTGSAQSNVSPRDIEKLAIPAFASPYRRAVGHILENLEAKILLNEELSQTVESIAQTLFRSWFVDFDPVRAKMRGEKPVGMDDATTALFPDSMEESELGEIPAGWSVEDLSEHLTVQKGKSYRSADLADSRSALVTLKSFKRGGGYRADGLKPYVGDYKPEQLVSPGDLVVAYTDVTQAGDIIGKPAIVEPNPAFDVLVASLDVGIVTPRTGSVNKSYLYNLFLQNDFQNHIAGHSSGTTVLHLSRSAVESFKVPVPSRDVMLAFGRVAEPLLQLKRALVIESSSLANLRDSLLPRLISGELQVPEDLVA